MHGNILLHAPPQVSGLLNCHGVLAHSPLSQVHLFSSISADVGNAGQSNYAAANAAISAIAQQQAAQVGDPGSNSLLNLQCPRCTGARHFHTRAA